MCSRCLHDNASELVRSAETPGRYLTVDRVAGEEAWHVFRRDRAGDYQRLDVECSGLTLAERGLAP